MESSLLHRALERLLQLCFSFSRPLPRSCLPSFGVQQPRSRHRGSTRIRRLEDMNQSELSQTCMEFPSLVLADGEELGAASLHRLGLASAVVRRDAFFELETINGK